MIGNYLNFLKNMVKDPVVWLGMGGMALIASPFLLNLSWMDYYRPREPRSLEIQAQRRADYSLDSRVTLVYPDGRREVMPLVRDYAHPAGIRALVAKHNRCEQLRDFDLAVLVTANLIKADERQPRNKLSEKGGVMDYHSEFSGGFPAPKIKEGEVYPVAVNPVCQR